MNEIPFQSIIPLIATEPEHCLDCFRLIRPGERYHLGKDSTVLCPMCASTLLIGEDFDTIQATERVAVDYGGGLLRLRREGSAIILAPGEVRHLVDALVEAATRAATETTETRGQRSSVTSCSGRVCTTVLVLSPRRVHPKSVGN